MTDITFGSLFSGIAAPELAFSRHGAACLFASEIDPDAVSVTRRHFPGTLQLGDINYVGKHNAPAVDIICGGSPCQDLSIAGNRAGLAGNRSGLFRQYIRVVRELRPTFAVWENVPGAFSANAGRDFACVVHAFHECGARDIAWRVIDAQYTGVPQRRKRIFLVADFTAERAGEILFEPSGAYRHRPPRKEAGVEVAYTLTTGNQRLDASSNETFIGVKAVDARNAGVSDIAMTLQDGTTLNSLPLIAGTLSASAAGTMRPAGQKNELDFLIPAKSGTLTQQSMFSQPKGIEGDFLIPDTLNRVRRLTPLECERLQGLPDNWTKYRYDGSELSDRARYRMVGNSIAVPAIEWIAERMMKVLRGEAL